ncbi:hypothetical protein Tco_0836014 [Tanacetum coccineum]
MDKCHRHQKDIPDVIHDWIERGAAIPVDGKEGSPDVCITELGGTTGFSTKNPIEIMSQMVVSGKHIQQLGEAIIILLMSKHLVDLYMICSSFSQFYLPHLQTLSRRPIQGLLVQMKLGAYIHHKEIKAAQEIKITAQEATGSLSYKARDTI